MSQRSTAEDDLPAIVAAVVALLSSLDDDATNTPPDNWRASGQVLPGWREVGEPAWRDRERRRGWRHWN